MTAEPSAPLRLDHLALASRRVWPQLTRYNHELGGRWLGGPRIDETSSFYFCQVGFEGGTKIELLEPLPVSGSDFLRRFLDRNGPGPHHLTFKVDDFDAAVAGVEAAGYEVIGSDRSDPDWHEAFLHPKQSHGIVIQLAWEGPREEGWPEPEPLPPPARATVPALTGIDHLVADLDAAVELFTGPLAMTAIARHDTDAGRHALLASGPWRLALIEPAAPAWQHWMGTRPGRVLAVRFTLDGQAAVGGAEPADGGWFEVPPEHNLGTRLLLCPTAAVGSDAT